MIKANLSVEADMLSALAHSLVHQVIICGCAKELAQDPAAQLAFQRAKEARAQLLQDVNAYIWRMGMAPIDQSADLAEDPFREIRAIVDNHDAVAFGAVERRGIDLRHMLKKAIDSEELTAPTRNFLQTILSRAEAIRDDISALRRLSQADDPATAGPHPEKARRILLVEDNPEVAAVTKEMLQFLGWRVTRTANAAGALEALSDEIDLLISDVMIPGSMNGLDLARAVRQRRPGLPVVLVTGYAERVRRQAEEAGIPLLVKPYTLESIEAILETAWPHER
jgi:CheY-like chemotaxis protein